MDYIINKIYCILAFSLETHEIVYQKCEKLTAYQKRTSECAVYLKMFQTTRITL